MANYLKLEWWNECDLGDIYYAGGYVNKFYYETEVGKPEYVVEQDTQENGEGEDVVLSQVRKKIYQIEMYVPEYVVDSLVDMALHDNIRLTYTNGLYSSVIRNVEVGVVWEEDSNDCMAVVTIKFQQDDQLVDNACCSPLNVLECLTPCLTVIGFKDDHESLVQNAYYIDKSDSPVIVQYVSAAFLPVDCDNNYVFSEDADMEMFWNGTAWYEAPEITGSSFNLDVINNILSVNVTGQALPNTFLQAYYSTNGVTYFLIGDPVTAAVFLASGISFTLSPIPALTYVKVFMYNHNCQYQYSKPVNS